MKTELSAFYVNLPSALPFAPLLSLLSGVLIQYVPDTSLLVVGINSFNTKEGEGICILGFFACARQCIKRGPALPLRKFPITVGPVIVVCGTAGSAVGSQERMKMCNRAFMIGTLRYSGLLIVLTNQSWRVAITVVSGTQTDVPL